MPPPGNRSLPYERTPVTVSVPALSAASADAVELKLVDEVVVELLQLSVAVHVTVMVYVAGAHRFSVVMSKS